MLESFTPEQLHHYKNMIVTTTITSSTYMLLFHYQAIIITLPPGSTGDVTTTYMVAINIFSTGTMECDPSNNNKNKNY